MTLQQFITQNTGTKVGTGQCGELVDLYLVEVCNNHTSYDTALEYWQNGIPGFTIVTTPEAGDLACYNAHGTYIYGHIAIYAGNGEVFEQNADPDGSPPHLFARANTYLLGYLRQGESMTPITDTITQDLYGAFVGREPNQNELDSWRGRDVALLIQALEVAPETTAYYEKVQAALKNTTTLNKTSVEAYIQEHLS